MPFGTKNTRFYLSIFMKFFVWWCYYRVLKYSTWVVFDKNLGSPQHPQNPFFGIRRLVTTQIFESFRCQNFFRGRSVEKNKLPKDAYRVTWLGRKKLGHCTCTTWVRNRKRQQMRIFDHFSPNPQIGFLAILGRGCVGAGQKHGAKSVITWGTCPLNISG